MRRRALVFSFLSLFLVALFGCSRDDSGPITSTPNGGQLDFEGDALQFAAAIEADDFEVMAAMVRGGFDPDIHFSRRSEIPLVAWPIVVRKKESLRKFLELGADPNAAKPAKPGDSLTLESPRYFDNAMVRAAIDSDPEYLEILIAHGGDPDARGISGDTLIHRLLNYDLSFERTEWLISRGADIDSRVHGATLFDVLMRTGVSERALRLLELGADPMPMRWVAAPRGADGKLIPQSNLPVGAASGMVYDDEGLPALAPYLRMVEDICWKPQPNPVALDLQQKMQQVLKDRGVDCPSEPERHRVMREKAV